MASPNLLVSVSWHKYVVRDMERTPYSSCDLAEQDGTAINYRRTWEVRALRSVSQDGGGRDPLCRWLRNKFPVSLTITYDLHRASKGREYVRERPFQVRIFHLSSPLLTS